MAATADFGSFRTPRSPLHWKHNDCHNIDLNKHIDDREIAIFCFLIIRLEVIYG